MLFFKLPNKKIYRVKKKNKKELSPQTIPSITGVTLLLLLTIKNLGWGSKTWERLTCSKWAKKTIISIQWCHLNKITTMSHWNFIFALMALHYSLYWWFWKNVILVLQLLALITYLTKILKKQLRRSPLLLSCRQGAWILLQVFFKDFLSISTTSIFWMTSEKFWTPANLKLIDFNLTVFWCFQGLEKGCIANEWVVWSQ